MTITVIDVLLPGHLCQYGMSHSGTKLNQRIILLSWYLLWFVIIMIMSGEQTSIIWDRLDISARLLAKIDEAPDNIECIKDGEMESDEGYLFPC